ncbi:hypothetical protein BCF55_1114 [Hydrogenivirga caldilitoris]|uniref:Uncharacterized protein n=1 Tax=Hydrogenivirga caldilitoris TaxID=246264 RepID=A0A497XRP7_9AQUI|nr:hypothetical protein [Hydrogenivirga caldilitoris]RLJ70830.1 hypothetical protein BCF55_1114 [Hydrogenivirga caldilitoris]
MIPAGLNLLYLPPFSIVARFFLTASLFCLFGVLISLYMLFTGTFSLQALVHTYTVGFMAMTMFGALFQMLPVVAGATIENPLPKAAFTHVTLTLGTLLFVTGFLLSHDTVLYTGLFILSISFLFVAPMMLFKLLKLKSYSPTSLGMKFALAFFLGAFLTGLLLLFGLKGVFLVSYTYLLQLHVSLMLWGWVALLIASVAFQVIEMFFVTPPYLRFFSYNLPYALTLLFFFNLLTGFHWSTKLLLSLLYISFVVLTVTRLLRRRRKISDPLISLWYTGMFFLFLSCLLYPFIEREFRVFLLFLFTFGTFAQSVIMAMMYRIIPFLVWIHLSNKGIPNAPTMHEVIRPKRVWWSYYMHLMSIFIFLVSFFSEVRVLWLITALSYLVSFATLFLNLLSGILTYLRRGAQQGAFPQH